MRVALFLSTLLLATLPSRGVMIESTFEASGLAPGTFYNGSDLAGGFQSGWAHLGNGYNTNWFSWSGFSVSTVVNTNTPGWDNQYAAWMPGHGVGGSASYAVVFDSSDAEDDVITFALPSCVRGLYINNATYTALSMLNGDAFAKKFGGADGHDPDYLLLEITGKDAAGVVQGTMPFYLADFRFTNNVLDYVVSDWTWVDLTSLGCDVATLHFALQSTDNSFGFMNTPAYFVIDDLQLIPKPNRPVVAGFEDVDLMDSGVWRGENPTGGVYSRFVHFQNSFNTTFKSWSGFAVSRVNDTSTPGFGNPVAVWHPGVGVGGDGQYAVGFDSSWDEQDVVTFASAVALDGLYVNNTTYAALSMLNGDAFAKKFGGLTGNDPDWFKLVIEGRDSRGMSVGQHAVYLADYRFADNESDYILGEWQWVDLSGFDPRVKTLHFSLSSSDNSFGFMNTPGFFALDDIAFRYAFSGAAEDTTAFDSAVPGFVGPAGDGTVDVSNNYVNAAFAGWVSSVVDYAPASGLAPEWTNTQHVLGAVSGDQTAVLSLGEPTPEQLAAGAAPGSVTLAVSTPVSDETGPDFVIFENALQSHGEVFADLAQVAVSSDGTHFARFPVISLTPTNVGTYATISSERLYNLVGKHANGYGRSWGTPFDLADLACDALVQSGKVDIAQINFVRITDIPGDGSVRDDSAPSHPVFDPLPTFLSGGADIDAVGVINSPDYARVATEVYGPGYISPYGMPAGVVAVPNGGNAVFDIVPLPGHHLIDVQINGISVGATNEYRFSAVSSDQSITAIFGSRLTISSAYAIATPFIGAQLLPHGLVDVSLAQSVVTQGTTQYVSQGWIGQGSAPTSGVTSQTGVFMLTNDTIVTWLWRTNYWLAVNATQGGSVEGPPSGWYALGATVAPRARPDAFYRFTGWTGDTAGDTNALNQSIVMDQPRSLLAHFWADVATNAVPLDWLAQQGLTNGSADALSLSDSDGDGLLAWQEFFAGTDPNNPSSVFAVVDFGFANGSNFIAWTGGTNGSSRPFRIESSPRAEHGWLTVADAVSRNGSGLNIYWWPATNTAEFYRVGVAP